ncbi:MAG TPA: exodeoxyribonuclease V subunit beta, partial [Janibacter terrae]|nr:exodeoxyribonuclease V subunit beta [Janibacter terrae]
MSTLTPFDITADLPTGTVLLEASAGTGKTWTIGALVSRYVAEGQVRLEDMLVITFGRAASREMRERVREHLRHVHRHVADPRIASEDPVVALLRTGSEHEVAERARRLRDALTHFDAATIATTHQFCQIVLRSLGVAGDSDAHARLVDDLSDLREEVVDDLYVRGFAGGGEPAFSRQRAGEIARAVTENPHAVLDPGELEGQGADARALRFAHLVRREMDRRKRRLGVLGYDDLLSHLADALEDEDSPARERMRHRWRVVLVDEFQDTDPVQWQVLDRAFSG